MDRAFSVFYGDSLQARNAVADWKTKAFKLIFAEGLTQSVEVTPHSNRTKELMPRFFHEGRKEKNCKQHLQIVSKLCEWLLSAC